jgi:hypothetical protein
MATLRAIIGGRLAIYGPDVLLEIVIASRLRRAARNLKHHAFMLEQPSLALQPAAISGQ